MNDQWTELTALVDICVPVAKATELVLKLMETCASSQHEAEKNAAARPPGLSFHFSTMSRGFHNAVPQIFSDALAPTMPQRPTVVRKSGRARNCQN
jgi:hypothetical protein